MPTFRPVTDEEAVGHESVIAHAFGSDAGPPEHEGPDDLDERLAERWALAEDGDLLSVGLIYDMETNLAGESVAVGGLGGFATSPEHRGNAHGETFQRELLAEFRDRGYPYALLWPKSIPYYRETGWGVVHRQTQYAFQPETVRGAGWGGDEVATAASEGRFERLEPDEYERLVPVYESFRERYDLALDRSPTWWREWVLEDTWTYCWTPAGADEPDGYVVYTLPGEQGDVTLSVDELVSRTEPARRALLSFLARHLPQVETVEWTAPVETRLLDDAVDPKEIHAGVVPGAMGRVVDVPAAVESLPASRNPPEPITITVEDSLVAASDDTFVVAAGADGPTCEPVAASGEGAPDGDGDTLDGDTAPDVELTVGLLSRFLAGAVAPSTASERGAFAADGRALQSLDALFPERDGFLADFF